jgi:GH18 family chitinase
VNDNHLAGIMLWNIKQDLPANNPDSLLSTIFNKLSPPIDQALFLQKKLSTLQENANGKIGRADPRKI